MPPSNSDKRPRVFRCVRATKSCAAVARLAASQVARLQRQAHYDEVVTLYQQGKSIAAIVEQFHLSPTTVRKYVYAGAFPERTTHAPLAKDSLVPTFPIWSNECKKAVTMPACGFARTPRSGMYERIQGRQYAGSREYQQKPGRRSSAQGLARRQAFLSTVKAEAGSLQTQEQEVSDPLPTPVDTDGAVVLEEPLESPRHLTWLLLRD